MNFAEILRMALGSLGVNKLRSFLTMSGITIGVFSVIGVMTVITGLRDSIEAIADPDKLRPLWPILRVILFCRDSASTVVRRRPSS